MRAVRRGAEGPVAGRPFDRPFQSVGGVGGEARADAADQQRRCGDRRDRRADTRPALRLIAAQVGQQPGAVALHGAEQGGGRSPLAQADQQMDRQHEEQEASGGQGRDARRFGLEGHGRRAEHEGCDGCCDRCRRDPAVRRRPRHEGPEHQRVGCQARERRHVQDVASQGEQPAVGEEQALQHQHRGEGREGRPGTQHRREQDAAYQVAARSRARNREVDHLRREDEGAHHPHERDDVRLVAPCRRAAARAADRYAQQRQRSGSRGGGYRRGDQCVGHVHGRQALAVRFDWPSRPFRASSAPVRALSTPVRALSAPVRGRGPRCVAGSPPDAVCERWDGRGVRLSAGRPSGGVRLSAAGR